MTIKLNKAVKAYLSSDNLNRQKVNPGRLAKQIFDLHKKLSSAFDFQKQEEEKIYATYPDFNPETMSFNIKDKTEDEKQVIYEMAKKLQAEINGLGTLDYGIEVEPFDINLDLVDLKISGEDIGNLEGFVNFI